MRGIRNEITFPLPTALALKILIFIVAHVIDLKGYFAFPFNLKTKSGMESNVKR